MTTTFIRACVLVQLVLSCPVQGEASKCRSLSGSGARSGRGVEASRAPRDSRVWAAKSEETLGPTELTAGYLSKEESLRRVTERTFGLPGPWDRRELTFNTSAVSPVITCQYHDLPHLCSFVQCHMCLLVLCGTILNFYLPCLKHEACVCLHSLLHYHTMACNLRHGANCIT